ncbi:MAG: ABC transporter permease subunit [Enterocloster clostridioformis]
MPFLSFGADTKSFTSVVTLPAIKLAGGEMTITGETVVTILSCVIIMIGLTAFINKSKAGQAMLAVSEDRGAATLMGINVSQHRLPLHSPLAPHLAATGGRAAALLRVSVPYSLCWFHAPGIKAFVAAVFGGIGSIPGAFIGGILLGVIEILSKACISLTDVQMPLCFPS